MRYRAEHENGRGNIALERAIEGAEPSSGLKLRFTRRRFRTLSPAGYVAAPDTKVPQKGTKASHAHMVTLLRDFGRSARFS